MLKSSGTLILLFCFLFGIAQNPASKALSPNFQGKDNIREKLVSLALQNPDYELVDIQRAQAIYDVKIAKAEWLDYFFAAANLNEYTINKPPDFPALYPRYNFGLKIPFGSFVATPARIKKARLQVESFDVAKRSQASQIKEKVLTAYETYLMNKDLLKLQASMTEDEKVLFIKAETDFAGNKVSLNQYNDLLRSYKLSQEAYIKSKRELAVSRIILERMLGKDIEELIANN